MSSPPLAGIVVILGIAMLVAIVARRLRLPYTVGLVVVGALLAVTRAVPPVALTHDLIFFGILPPLLFEASLALPWRRLRADFAPILLLSTVGTVVSAGVTTAGMILLLHWPATSALVFGVLIAATDPVAVIALMKEQGVHGRLRILVEAESLFNDGVAAVLFSLAMVFATASAAPPDGGRTLLLLAGTVSGGIGIGLAVGAAAMLFAWRTPEHVVETALTVVAAYGAFILAESVHASGVLATVAAGLLMGNFGVRNKKTRIMSAEGRKFVVAFWDFAAFLANSVVFPLIGITLASMTLTPGDLVLLPVAILVVLASRALTVYPLCLLFTTSRWSVPAAQQHVLFWGGLRGALALALALTLPPEMPGRDAIVVAAFGVAAFSIVVQGLTMPLLLRWLGIKRDPLPDQTPV